MVNEGQKPLLSVSDALSAIKQTIQPLPFEPCLLEDAHARYVATEQIAQLSHPPADVSAMDGYAVRASDIASLPASLKLIDEAAAGTPATKIVGAGEAIRIFTGAVVPSGADTIIIQENTERTGDNITILEASVPGRYIRKSGQDFAKGSCVIRAGTPLTARDLGLLASSGITKLDMLAKPRVAIINSGDELVKAGTAPAPGQLANSNGPMLAAMIRQLDAIPIMVGSIPDRAGALDEALNKLETIDLIVTTGGASVGAHDHIINDLTASSQSDVNFWRIAMRPGKPLIFAHWRDVPLLGLPGNPVSAGVCALLFVQTAIAALQGRAFEFDICTATLSGTLAENDQREEYMRATLTTDESGTFIASPASQQDSAMLSLFAHADGLIIRPPFAPPVVSGDKISVLKFPSGF